MKKGQLLSRRFHDRYNELGNHSKNYVKHLPKFCPWVSERATTIIENVFRDVHRMWKHGIIHLTAANWLRRGSALAQRIVLARILGPENIGHIGVVNAVLSLIRLPAGAGTFTVVTKLMAENAGKIENQRDVIGTTIWVNIVTSAIVLIVSWLILQQTEGTWDLDCFSAP